MWTLLHGGAGRGRVMADNKYSLVESLKLIIQSQLVLAELQNNQRRLESLIARLETRVEDPNVRP